MTGPEQHADIVRETALLADWAEEPTAISSVDADNCRARIMCAVDALVAQAERAATLERERDEWKERCILTHAEESARFEQARAEADRLQEGMRGLREHAEREPLNVDISDYGDEWCAGFLAGQAHALDEAMAGCPDCGVTESIGDGLCDQHRSCPDCGIPEVWCRRVSSDKSHCWRWDYEQFDESESEVDRLREALRLMLQMHDRHPRWCGFNKDAPGDSIVNEAPAAARAALSVLDDREET